LRCILLILANMPTLITPDSPLSLEQDSVDTWVSFARSRPLQVGQFSVIANKHAARETQVMGDERVFLPDIEDDRVFLPDLASDEFIYQLIIQFSEAHTGKVLPLPVELENLMRRLIKTGDWRLLPNIALHFQFELDFRKQVMPPPPSSPV
ncbi:hypothetical protein, partial [Roseateles albus]